MLALFLMDLRRLREEQSLSVEDVASRLSKSHSTIRNWESGKTEPTLSITETVQLCALYACSLEQLYEAVLEIQNSSGRSKP